MNRQDILRAAARNWENANEFTKAAERYAQANRWNDAGRCLAKAGRPVEAANAYARADNPIEEARQWLVTAWPERARRPYQRALERELVTSDEMEALLGVGEIDLASERAFIVASNVSSSNALRFLARLAAARGRPDLAARAWDLAIGREQTSGGDVLDDWAVASPWNQSLGWGRSLVGTSTWPSRSFEDVRLELAWENTLGNYMSDPGKGRGMAWSFDGRMFAIVNNTRSVIFGTIGISNIKLTSLPIKASVVTFTPNSRTVLIGCHGGEVHMTDTLGETRSINSLKTSGNVWSISCDPNQEYLAVSHFHNSGSLLRIWAWNPRQPENLVYSKHVNCGNSYPLCAWSPDGLILSWQLGADRETNQLYAIYPNHEWITHKAPYQGKIIHICFSPDSRYIIIITRNQLISIEASHRLTSTNAAWGLPSESRTIHFHPELALLVAGGRLFRITSIDNLDLELIKDISNDRTVSSSMFSPDGKHLLVNSNGILRLYRVHLL